jgi:hypothetical protein
MKHTPSSLSKNYKPLILWRDDLEEITSIIQRRGATLEIKHAEYSYETVEELEGHIGPRDQTEFKISGSKPYISIDLDSHRTSLYVGGGEPDASGIFFELDRVLAARQRRWPLLYSMWFCQSILLSLVAINVLASHLQIAPWYVPTFLAVIQIAAMLWLVWAFFVGLIRHSIVRMERRATARSFLRRNKDQLIVAIIAAVVGAVLGILGTKLSEQITAKIDTKTNQPPASNP